MNINPSESAPKHEPLSFIEDERFEMPNGDIIIRRDVVRGDDTLAHLDLNYSPKDRIVSIDTVGILDPKNFNNGYGKQMYEAVATLKTDPDEESYTLVSKAPSIQAQRVWESFVRRRKAIKHEDGSYEMLGPQ